MMVSSSGRKKVWLRAHTRRSFSAHSLRQRTVMDQQSDPGPDLECFREYLSLLARLQVEQRLRARIDLSGVVQQTLLEAYQARGQLHGQNQAQVAAWLRRILANNLADEVRRLIAGKRDPAREFSLEAALEASSARLQEWLAAEQSSPSERVIQQEQGVRLAWALAALPESQRRAVELHHLQGRSLAEVAAELDLSRPAVAGLLHRGLKRLRELLEEDER
jgi:RNA polymerase sigma-70 factor (ECF subfamily)